MVKVGVSKVRVLRQYFRCTPVRWSLVQSKAVLRSRRPLRTRRDLEVEMRAGKV